MKINEITDRNMTARSEFASVEEFAGYAAPFVTQRFVNGMREDLGNGHFYGADCPTPGTAFTMARDGWERHLDDTLDLARDAVTTVEAQTDVTVFSPVWDVSGAMVDVGEYLAGVPECMIELPPAPTTRYGRVVTLCASVSVSGAVGESTLVARGKVITALALELSRLGIATELYADMSASEHWGGGRTGHKYRARVLVKGPNDILDPAKILFTYAHPGMLRVLALTAMHGLPDNFKRALGVSRAGGYGIPLAPEHDLPEGTIYLPELCTDRDYDAATELRTYMTELGLVEAS